MSLSHFVDVKNVTYGPSGSPTSIGSVSNLRIMKNNKRVEGVNNNVVSGPVSSHIVEAGYSFSFDTNDFSVANFFRDPANQIALSVLNFINVPSQTQAGTPLGDTAYALVQCLIDTVDSDNSTKSLNKFSVKGHTLATANDSDQLSLTATSS